MFKSVLLGFGVIPFCLLYLATCTTFDVMRIEKTKVEESCLTSFETVSSTRITQCISQCTAPCIAVDYDDAAGTCKLFSGDCGIPNPDNPLKELFVSKTVFGKFFVFNYL